MMSRLFVLVAFVSGFGSLLVLTAAAAPLRPTPMDRKRSHDALEALRARLLNAEDDSSSVTEQLTLF